MRTVTALVAEGGERLLYAPLTGGESGVAGQQNTNPRTSGLDAGSGFGERCLEPAGQFALEPAQPLLVFVTEDHIHDAAVRRQGEGGAFPEQQGGQRLPIGRGAQGLLKYYHKNIKIYIILGLHELSLIYLYS